MNELWRCSRRGCNWVGTNDDKIQRRDRAPAGFISYLLVCPLCECQAFYTVKDKWVKLIGGWFYRRVGKHVEVRYGRSARYGPYDVTTFLNWVYNTENRLLTVRPAVMNVTVMPPVITTETR